MNYTAVILSTLVPIGQYSSNARKLAWKFGDGTLSLSDKHGWRCARVLQLPFPREPSPARQWSHGTHNESCVRARTEQEGDLRFRLAFTIHNFQIPNHFLGREIYSYDPYRWNDHDAVPNNQQRHKQGMDMGCHSFVLSVCSNSSRICMTQREGERERERSASFVASFGACWGYSRGGSCSFLGLVSSSGMTLCVFCELRFFAGYLTRLSNHGESTTTLCVQSIHCLSRVDSRQ